MNRGHKVFLEKVLNIYKGQIGCSFWNESNLPPSQALTFPTSLSSITCGKPALSVVTVHCSILFLYRFPSGLHSAVSNQGHLDVVCASPLQAEPHSGPPGHRGPGRCAKGKAESLPCSWYFTYILICNLNSTFRIHLCKLEMQLVIMRLNSVSLNLLSW